MTVFSGECPVCGNAKVWDKDYCDECLAYEARVQAAKMFKDTLSREEKRRRHFGDPDNLKVVL